MATAFPDTNGPEGRHLALSWRATLALLFIVLASITPLAEAQALRCNTTVGLRSWSTFYSQLTNVSSSGDCCTYCLMDLRCGGWSYTAPSQCNLVENMSPTTFTAESSSAVGIKSSDTLTVPLSANFTSFNSSNALRVAGSAMLSYSALALTYGISQTGLAMLASPVQMLRDRNLRCEAASFSTSFSFMKDHIPTTAPAAGFTFFILSSDIPLESLGFTRQYTTDGMHLGVTSNFDDSFRRPGALAIEFDTFRDSGNGDPDSSHVGINLNYNSQSLITVSTVNRTNVDLRDIRMKYVWVDYNATKKTLRVFLSYSPTKPLSSSSAILSYSIDLCTALRPPNCGTCAASTNAYVGFSGATQGQLYQLTYIFSWNFQTSWPTSQPGTPGPSNLTSIMQGCKFENFDLQGLPNVFTSSAAECASRCAALPQCMAYNWWATTCTFKSAGDTMSQGDQANPLQFCGERFRTPATTPQLVSMPTLNSSSPFIFIGSPVYTSNSIIMTSAQSQVGLALLRQPVQLIRDIDSRCEAASWSASFSFRTYNPSSNYGYGSGLTFLLLGANLLFGQLGISWGSGLTGMGFYYLPPNKGSIPGGLAVEFDTAQDANLGAFELKEPHVGINTRFSAASLAAVATSAFTISLTDGNRKYVWVDYDAELGALAVFLSYSPIKPQTAILSYTIDMCAVLRPGDCGRSCASVSAAYMGIGASTSNGASQTAEVFNLQFSSMWLSDSPDTGGFSLGLVASGMVPTKLNQYFRYASMGYISQSTIRNPRPPTWLVATQWNWTVDAVSSVADQGTCSACYALSTTAAMESAYYITYYSDTQTVPKIAAQQLVDCAGTGKCRGGWPGDVLDYAAKTPLVPDSAYAYRGVNSTCSVPPNLSETYQIGSFEAVNFFSWFGLLLAVQQTPVIVNIEASGVAFINYAGGIFEDPSCYTRGVDHSVLVVGYDITSSPPFWIIRNSWGTRWGEQGYMRMAIRPGDGICGINTMPGYIPVFKPTDPCNTNSYPWQTGIFNPDTAPGRLNPCGGGICTIVNGTRNRCTCPRDFTPAANSDGSETCVPVSPCTFLPENPCRVGTCLDSQTKPGTFTCLCPMGYDLGQVAIDNSTTCVPAALVLGLQYYTIPPDVNVTCARVYEVYGISRTAFLAQNPSLSCTQPLPAGTRVNVTNDFLRGCALPYAVNPGDTCNSIAMLFLIPSLSGPGSPNPDLNCTDLQPGMQVCINRRSSNDTAAPDVPLCTGWYTAAVGETCTSIISSKFGGISMAFFALNPGLYCNNFNRFSIANTGISLPVGQRVCTAATNLATIQRGCNGRLIDVRPGDTCLSLLVKFYCGRRAVFRQYNRQWNCDNSKLLASQRSNTRLRLCAPMTCPKW